MYLVSIMKIKNEKYQQELIDSLDNIFENSSIDKDFNQWAAFSARNANEEEKQELIDTIRAAKPLEDNEMSDCVRALHYSFLLLEVHECPHWSKKILQVMAVVEAMNAATVKYTEIKKKEEKSLAAKNRVSRHKGTSLRIAADTWAVYPNASRAGMADKIREYILSIPGSKPVPNIERFDDWLKESGLCPNVKIRNRNFQLIINKEGV